MRADETNKKAKSTTTSNSNNDKAHEQKKNKATAAAVAVSEVSREFVLEFATSVLHICCNNWHACIIATRT